MEFRGIKLGLGLFVFVICGSVGSAQIVVPANTGFNQNIPLAPGETLTHINGVPVGNPTYVTQNQISGYNPQTGGLNTFNQQISQSAFDPYRHSSQFNGSKRWVRRPVRNQHGQIVGYQEGWVWNNSATGFEHHNMNTFTPNGHGGYHQNHSTRSRGRR